MTDKASYSVFADSARHVHTGPDLAEAVEHGRRAYGAGAHMVVVFDDTTGDRTEIDPRADGAAACAWLHGPSDEKRTGPGRPKLGVVSREVSLLPRHWEWLNAQRGGASAALRLLVDEARKQHRQRDEARVARDAAYKFMSVVGGDLAGFEEASRALYAGRFVEAAERIAAWPDDLRTHATRLLEAAAGARDREHEAPAD